MPYFKTNFINSHLVLIISSGDDKGVEVLSVSGLKKSDFGLFCLYECEMNNIFIFSVLGLHSMFCRSFVILQLTEIKGTFLIIGVYAVKSTVFILKQQILIINSKRYLTNKTVSKT